MKRVLIFMGIVLLAGLLIPLFTAAGERRGGDAVETFVPQPATSGTSATTVSTKTQTKDGEERTVRVLFSDTGEVRELPLEEYVTGVVLAEMPWTFEAEALKAQAVASRSYTFYRQEMMAEHPALGHKDGAAVCTDYRHCKAYLSLAQAEEQWGKALARQAYEKISRAVEDTKGIVMEYDDQPVNAVFHAISSGRTENARDVWGGSLPYLTSVDSEGDVDAPGYLSTVSLTPQEMKDKLLAGEAGLSLGEDPSSWLGRITRTDGGSVDTVQVGGKSLTGVRLRELLGLRSACFTAAYENGAFLFTVRGYGHGVGMSQYGADAMAKAGKNYRDILLWYYKGVELVKLS